MKPRVAVIDVGSNSIKALVAAKGPGMFGLEVLFEHTLEVRISQGIGGHPPRLHPDRIEAGVEAVRDLWKECTELGPLAAMRIVATSAVRSAANGNDFTDAVTRITGIQPQVLSGAEEADAIAMGVRTDPGIEDHLTDFTVFDLGGGSLEIIRFEKHEVTARTSLPLGSVRMTEEFFPDPTKAIPRKQQEALADFLRKEILKSGIPVKEPLVGCSGGLAALRGIVRHRHKDLPTDKGAYLSRGRIEELAEIIASTDLADRIALPGMPARRADIFPSAMITFGVLLDIAKAEGIFHSLHNLRYGLSLRLLQDTIA